MVDSNLVNNTKWTVASLEGDTVGKFHKTKWLFRKNGTVQAGTFWKGSWTAVGTNHAHLQIGKGSNTDGFDLHFLTPIRFVATKNGLLYRLGRRFP